MLDFLRDGAWQAIGAFLAVAAIVVSIMIFHWQRQRRSLTYDVKSVYALLKGTEELHGRLSVQVDGTPVRNIDVMFIEVQNSGNHPIARGDFDLPFGISFEPPARIISAVIDLEEPKNLAGELEVTEQSLTLKPLLLNAGDRLTLKLLLSSNSRRFVVQGRVLGVKSIERAKPRAAYTWLALVGLVLVAAGIWFSTANAPARTDLPPRPPAFWYGIGVAAFGYLLAGVSLVKGNGLARLLRRMAVTVDRLK